MCQLQSIWCKLLVLSRLYYHSATFCPIKYSIIKINYRHYEANHLICKFRERMRESHAVVAVDADT